MEAVVARVAPALYLTIPAQARAAAAAGQAALVPPLKGAAQSQLAGAAPAQTLVIAVPTGAVVAKRAMPAPPLVGAAPNRVVMEAPTLEEAAMKF